MEKQLGVCNLCEAICGLELTIEDGSVTPTLKVKRRTIESRYRDLIEGMYAAAGKTHVA